MGILFLVALVLAWPTFGLSLVVWFILAWSKAKNKVAKSDRREELKTVIEPLFQGRFADFYYALDVPTIGGNPSIQEAHQCGRHIMNYLAQNPSEAALFMKGLDKKLKTMGNTSLCAPVTAALKEKTTPQKGDIHLTSYRAIEAIITNNPNLSCFKNVSILLVSLQISLMSIK